MFLTYRFWSKTQDKKWLWMILAFHIKLLKRIYLHIHDLEYFFEREKSLNFLENLYTPYTVCDKKLRFAIYFFFIIFQPNSFERSILFLYQSSQLSSKICKYIDKNQEVVLFNIVNVLTYYLAQCLVLWLERVL